MNLFTKQIQDDYVRKNFETLEDAFNSLVFASGDFEFFEFEIKGAQPAFKLYHNLGFHPNDVIATKAIGSSFEFDYNKFNDKYITIKTTGSLYLRCFIGNMKGDEVKGNNAFADVSGQGGAGGGTLSFQNREAIVDADFLSVRKIVLPSAPVEGSMTIFYNGLPLFSSNYSVNVNVVTINNDVDLYLGDEFLVILAN
jgi:hypothetical protein